MALDELRRNIERDARAEASRIERDSDSSTKKTIGEAERAAGEIKKKAEENALAEVELKRKDMLIELEMEASSIIDAAKEENVERQLKVFLAMIRKRLYLKEQEIIKSAIRNFSNVVALEHSRIRISRKNAGLVKVQGAKIEPEEIRGVFLVSADGKVAADATIDGLVEANAEAIRGVLAGGLFG